jgi:hypothetical protein
MPKVKPANQQVPADIESCKLFLYRQLYDPAGRPLPRMPTEQEFLDLLASLIEYATGPLALSLSDVFPLRSLRETLAQPLTPEEYWKSVRLADDVLNWMKRLLVGERNGGGANLCLRRHLRSTSNSSAAFRGRRVEGHLTLSPARRRTSPPPRTPVPPPR